MDDGFRMLRIVLIITTVLLTSCANIPKQTNVECKPPCAIRFATYNIYWQNASKGKCNPDSITKIIHDINPDILVLQETYCFTENKLDRTFKHLYPYRYFRHCNDKAQEDGLGILSKYPIVKSYFFPPIYGWFPGCIFIIKTPKGYVQVLNVHLNPKLISHNSIGFLGEALWITPAKRWREINYYYHYLNPRLPVIVAGDFNENDNGAAAIYLREHGLRDLLFEKIPYSVKTWHWRFGPFKLTGRYDRIYTTASIRSCRCQVLQRGYSDHYPVMLDIESF